MRRKILILIFFTVLLILGTILGTRFLLSPPGTDPTLQEFVIEKGESIASIAKGLHQAGLIRSPSIFRLLVTARGLTLQAGSYQLSPTMSTFEIAEKLLHGTFDIKVTIIEGWRVEEVASYLNVKWVATRRSSGTQMSNVKFLEYAKEGYMFPETYFVPQDVTAEEIASLMRKTFEEKFTERMREDAKNLGLTLDEVVTLASIVEREAKYEEDRPIMAGILIKRFQNGWPLEADATVQYALATAQPPNCQTAQPPSCEWWPKDLTAEDLKIDSPYNTRKYPGLPPTPICNPGLSALNAALYPQESDYWYYVSDKEGKTYYAETLDKHNQNVVKYLK